MKKQIQQLIAAGNSEKALELLAQHNADALLLQAQFNNGRKNFNMGLIEHSEWQRIQARVNYAALELAGKLPDDLPPFQNDPADDKDAARYASGPLLKGTGDGNKSAGTPSSTGTGDGRLPPKVFLSYSPKNSDVAMRIKTFLEAAGAQVFIEQEPGVDLEHFIEEGIKDNNFVVSLISRDSLQSGWASKETTMGFIAQRLSNRRLFPVKIDNAYDEDDFYFESLDLFDQEIEKSHASIQKALARKADIRPFQDKLARYEDLKNNFGPIVQKLKSIYLVDIAGDNFEPGMGKVLKTMQDSRA